MTSINVNLNLILKMDKSSKIGGQTQFPISKFFPLQTFMLALQNTYVSGIKAEWMIHKPVQHIKLTFLSDCETSLRPVHFPQTHSVFPIVQWHVWSVCGKQTQKEQGQLHSECVCFSLTNIQRQIPSCSWNVVVGHVFKSGLCQYWPKVITIKLQLSSGHSAQLFASQFIRLSMLLAKRSRTGRARRRNSSLCSWSRSRQVRAEHTAKAGKYSKM